MRVGVMTKVSAAASLSAGSVQTASLSTLSLTPAALNTITNGSDLSESLCRSIFVSSGAPVVLPEEYARKPVGVSDTARARFSKSAWLRAARRSACRVFTCDSMELFLEYRLNWSVARLRSTVSIASTIRSSKRVNPLSTDILRFKLPPSPPVPFPLQEVR